MARLAYAQNATELGLHLRTAATGGKTNHSSASPVKSILYNYRHCYQPGLSAFAKIALTP